jgi:hypothetical protein
MLVRKSRSFATLRMTTLPVSHPLPPNLAFGKCRDVDFRILLQADASRLRTKKLSHEWIERVKRFPSGAKALIFRGPERLG